MLKFSRVKGIGFHPTKSWIIASNYDGDIAIFDYENLSEVQKYSEFSVPVRSVNFHSTQPLFVAGGDDAFIKIFNYETKNLVCNLIGHRDYVRSVEFHREKPLVISSSDDQTVKIWNYEKRNCILTINGHDHFVFSAFFHNYEPYVITACLDDSVRVWDVSAALEDDDEKETMFGLGKRAKLKFECSEHADGANYASFHPSRELAVSCSDDGTVKIWKVTEDAMSLAASLSFNSDSVLQAIFHPVVDVGISCSEDSTVEVWDTKTFDVLKKIELDGPAWCVAAHKTLPIFACGYEEGILVSRLLHTKPAFDCCNGFVYYYRDYQIRQYNLKTCADGVVGVTSPSSDDKESGSPLDSPPKRICYNQTHNFLLVSYKNKFELHDLNKSSRNGGVCYKGKNAIWVSRSHFAYFGDLYKTLYVREVKGSTETKIQIPMCKRMFSGPIGTVFLASNEMLYHFDVMRMSVLSYRPLPGVKRLYISPNKKLIGIITKEFVAISNIELDSVCYSEEPEVVRNGCWHDNIFLYATKTHIKYLLPTGDSGIIKYINGPTYIVTAYDNNIYSMSENNVFDITAIDLSECHLKIALNEGNTQKVISILKKNKLNGDSIISLIEKRGYPEIALHFATDLRWKFSLSLKAGDLKTAVDIAKEINDEDVWMKLYEVAMNQGRFSVAEAALKKSGNTDKLAFFYLISGQSKKLMKMEGDESLILQRSIWTNDRATESALLRDVSPSFSYIASRTSDAESVEIDEKVAKKLNKYAVGDLKQIKIPENDSVEDWPILNSERSMAAFDPNASDDNNSDNDWSNSEHEEEAVELEENDGWETEDVADEIPTAANHSKGFVLPSYGIPMEDKWESNCHVAGQLAAGGFFREALNELVMQIALQNPNPLKHRFLAAFVSSHSSLPLIASAPAIITPLEKQLGKRVCPVSSFSMERVKSEMEEGYTDVKKGKFSLALDKFIDVLQSLPLASVATKGEANEVKEMIEICKNYILAMTLGKESNEMKGKDAERQLELAAYFASIPLKPQHQRLAIMNAMTIAAKHKCYKTAYDFASSLPMSDHSQTKVKAVMENYRRNPTDAIQISYNSSYPFDVCAMELVPIYRGTKHVTCPFCGAVYRSEHKGKLCKICCLSEIGGESTGLVLTN